MREDQAMRKTMLQRVRSDRKLSSLDNSRAKASPSPRGALYPERFITRTGEREGKREGLSFIRDINFKRDSIVSRSTRFLFFLFPFFSTRRRARRLRALHRLVFIRGAGNAA